jgi:hypothetical protein
MNTIREAVSSLQQSIAAAMPDMEVSVNISLQAKEAIKQVKEKPVKLKPVKEPEIEAAKMMDAKDLKAILNAFMAKVGKDNAIKVVKKFTPKGTLKATDIPEAKYNALLKEIAKAEKDLEIKGEAA